MKHDGGLAAAREVMAEAVGRMFPHAPAISDNRKSFGYKCQTPIEFKHEGENYKRRCGKCKPCIASRKANAVGAAVAEMASAEEVVFATLTFAGSIGTGDLSDVMKRFDALRYRHHTQCARKGVRSRHFCVAERGERGTKRWHLHALFYHYGCSGMVTTPGGRTARQAADKWWPDGLYSVEVHRTASMTPDERFRVARYVGKYMLKHYATRFSGEVTVGPIRRSSGRRMVTAFDLKSGHEALLPRGEPLGTAFYEEDGRRYAAAGLPLSERIKVPGNVRPKSGNNRLGERVTIQAAGSVIAYGRLGYYRREAYKDEWRRLNGNEDWPMNDYMMRMDEDAVFRRKARDLPMRELIGKARKNAAFQARSAEAADIMQRLAAARAAKIAMAEPAEPTFELRNEAGEVVCVLWMKAQGELFDFERPPAGEFRDEANWWRVRFGDLDFVRGDFSAASREAAARWLAALRGPQWIPYREYRRLRDRLAELRNEALAKVGTFGADAPFDQKSHLSVRGENALAARRRRYDSIRAGPDLRVWPVAPEERRTALREVPI